MAYPTIRIDETGTATASGAGPAVEVTGAHARNHSSAWAKIGLFESSPPDLEDILLDGTAALRVGDNFRRVIDWKDDYASTTGMITQNTAELAGLTGIADVEPGDLVRVAGAGAAGADHYTAILTVDSETQVTLVDVALTSVSGAAVTIPRWILCDKDFPELAVDTAWSSGGTIDSPLNVGDLFGDLSGGWEVEVSPRAGGLPYDLADNITTLAAGGDTTGGPAILRGPPTGEVPAIEGDPGNELFRVESAMWMFRRLRLLGHLRAFALGSGAGEVLLQDVACEGNLIEVEAGGAGARVRLESSEISEYGDEAILLSGDASLSVANSLFHVTGASAGTAVKVASGVAASLRFRKSVVRGGNYGILSDGEAAAPAEIEDSIFDAGGNGISLAEAACRGAVLRGLQLHALSGTGITMAGAGALLAHVVDYNNFWGCAQARNGPEVGAHDTALDPEFQNPSAFDYRPGTAPRGAGWPRTFARGVQLLAADIGLPVPAGAGGEVPALIEYAELVGGTMRLGLQVLYGDHQGEGIFLAIPAARVPAAGALHLPAALEAIAAAIRDGATAASLVGQEVML